MSIIAKSLGDLWRFLALPYNGDGGETRREILPGQCHCGRRSSRIREDPMAPQLIRIGDVGEHSNLDDKLKVEDNG